MKITEYKIKMLIKEELDAMVEEGLMDVIASMGKKPKRKKRRNPDEEVDLKDPKKEEALDHSYELIQTFIHNFPQADESLSDVERFNAVEKLMRDLSTEMIWNLE